MNAVDLFLIRFSAAVAIPVVFLFIGFWMGRRTAKSPPAPTVGKTIGEYLEKKKFIHRDTGRNPFNDNLKPIRSRDRIPTIKEEKP